MKTITYTLPAHWAVYLINADASGYDDAELEAIDAFTENEGLGFCVSVSDDSNFVTWHDARDFYPYAADCAEFTFEVTK